MSSRRYVPVPYESIKRRTWGSAGGGGGEARKAAAAVRAALRKLAGEAAARARRAVELHRDLRIRFPLDPEEASARDDRLTLSSSDGSFSQAQTVKDDQVPGDKHVDLLFRNLDASLRYSLEVDPGREGSPYHVFRDVPFSQLANRAGRTA